MVARAAGSATNSRAPEASEREEKGLEETGIEDTEEQMWLRQQQWAKETSEPGYVVHAHLQSQNLGY